MEAIIKSGGGVLLNGTIHTSIATLPSKAELAAGDPVLSRRRKANCGRKLPTCKSNLKLRRQAGRRKTKKRIASLQTKLESTTDPAVQEKIQAQIAELEAKLGERFPAHASNVHTWRGWYQPRALAHP